MHQDLDDDDYFFVGDVTDDADLSDVPWWILLGVGVLSIALGFYMGGF